MKRSLHPVNAFCSAFRLLFVWFAIVTSLCGLETIARGTEKCVEIDKCAQVLRAYEGKKLILRTKVSTGRHNSTPNGSFTVEGKQLMHYSKRYHHSPMPYSVQVWGNYFIHGFSYVPDYPASHGCIRVPMSGINPAKAFYDWVEIGTPVVITGRWE